MSNKFVVEPTIICWTKQNNIIFSNEYHDTFVRFAHILFFFPASHHWSHWRSRKNTTACTWRYIIFQFISRAINPETCVFCLSVCSSRSDPAEHHGPTRARSISFWLSDKLFCLFPRQYTVILANHVPINVCHTAAPCRSNGNPFGHKTRYISMWLCIQNAAGACLFNRNIEIRLVTVTLAVPDRAFSNHRI